MGDDQDFTRTLYRKLLSLYPRAFREQLGESMEQTFTDLCNERKQQGERGWFGFVLWLYLDTAIGALQERLVSLKERALIKNLWLSATLSLLIVLPFVILEVATRSNAPGSNLSFVGYMMLWFLPMLFIFILLPVVQHIRAGHGLLANPAFVSLRVLFLVILAQSWVSFVIDQIPCFLGKTGC